MNKQLRKVTVALGCIALLAGSLPISSQAKETKVTKKVMQVGDTTRISSIPATVKLKVSKKGYVTILKKNRLTACKKGKVTLTWKSHSKIRKCRLTIKDSYLQLDWNKVTAATCINLQNGQKSTLSSDELKTIQSCLSKKQMKRTVLSSKPKAGSGKYGLHLQDANGKELYNITVCSKYISVQKAGDYKPVKASQMKKLLETLH